MTIAPHPFDHNQFVAIESRDDLPPGLPAMHFFKLDIEALHKAIMKMPLELGGFYVRALLAMYREMSPLPADDQQARAMLGVDVRTYKRLKKDLLAIPGCLIEKPSGRISNNRFEEEITAYVTEYRNRQRAARAREEKKRAAENIQTAEPANFQPTSGELPADLRPISGELPSDLESDLSEKDNEINGGCPTTQPQQDHNSGTTDDLRARVLEVRTRVRVRKKEEDGWVGGAHAREGAHTHARDASQPDQDRDIVEAPAIPWRVTEDGGFASRVFGLLGPSDVAEMRKAYPNLEFPAVLIEVDGMLRHDADLLGCEAGDARLVRRINGLLRRKQTDAKALVAEVYRKPDSSSDDACFWDGARLMVRGEMHADLLAKVDGDEAKLRDMLDVVAGTLANGMVGATLERNVRASCLKAIGWRSHDERRTRAIERRNGPFQSGNGDAAETRAQRLERYAAEAARKLQIEGSR